MTARGSFDGKSLTPQVPSRPHNPALEVFADARSPMDGFMDSGSQRSHQITDGPGLFAFPAVYSFSE